MLQPIQTDSKLLVFEKFTVEDLDTVTPSVTCSVFKHRPKMQLGKKTFVARYCFLVVDQRLFCYMSVMSK